MPVVALVGQGERPHMIKLSSVCRTSEKSRFIYSLLVFLCTVKSTANLSWSVVKGSNKAFHQSNEMSIIRIIRIQLTPLSI